MDCRTQLASLAIEELDKGDFLMATKILTTGIKLEPNNHELYFERSICHHKLGNFQASLDDVNTAIRLNSTDYNIHYQKGLALIGLSMFSEAVTSFKKAIELRAKQEDSKLSDIFKLLRDATNELNTARRRPGAPSHQARGESTQVAGDRTSSIMSTGPGTSNDPVDSTTDKPLNKAGSSTDNQNIASIDTIIKNGSNNLVAINRNSKPVPNNTNQVINGAIVTNRVSSSASHFNNCNNHMSSINVSPDISSINTPNDIMINQAGQHLDQSKSAQFEWNIRRSERIFLHHSNEPGTSGQQFAVIQRQHNQRQKTNSNPASISSGKSTKMVHDTHESQAYQPARATKSKDGTNSHVESDVDVDDSYNPQYASAAESTDPMVNRKRLMIAPSSSMPATSQGLSGTAPSKDDSYSSKYKRLRRDRERARRGTSKLCTIKLGDLEELQKASSSGSDKRSMRVIAPIDGWLYSGQLGVDDSFSNNGVPQYVVKLDGDSTGSSYLFTQETVLNDVIKEVRVKSVSELRKGARICCYWSRTYKCLSTGVVTSRTFEATKSLVSVKYDNGDLSALPLEDLRLLPPDYPKYMSNCDPLLLARNGDGVHASSNNQNGSRIIVEGKSTNSNIGSSTGAIVHGSTIANREASLDTSNLPKVTVDTDSQVDKMDCDDNHGSQVELLNHEEEEEDKADTENEDEDGAIPPTNETIDFITSENTVDQKGNIPQQEPKDNIERVTITKDNTAITLTNESQLITLNSRASSEENNYGIEYRPWVFEGPPKRSKRHGRTYRDNYSSIRRGNEVIKVGDSAELMPRDESILPFIAKVDGLWATGRGEMRVRVRWYYRLIETEGEPYELKDGENALFETDHFDENDVQSIYRSTKILSWTEYSKDHLGRVNKQTDRPKIFYLAGYYDPVRRVKHLRSDVKEAQ